MDAPAGIASAGLKPPAAPHAPEASPASPAFSLVDRINQIRQHSLPCEKPSKLTRTLSFDNSPVHPKRSCFPHPFPHADEMDNLTSVEVEKLLIQLVNENLNWADLTQALEQLGRLRKQNKMPSLSPQDRQALAVLFRTVRDILVDQMRRCKLQIKGIQNQLLLSKDQSDETFDQLNGQVLRFLNQNLPMLDVVRAIEAFGNLIDEPAPPERDILVGLINLLSEHFRVYQGFNLLLDPEPCYPLLINRTIKGLGQLSHPAIAASLASLIELRLSHRCCQDYFTLKALPPLPRALLKENLWAGMQARTGMAIRKAISGRFEPMIQVLYLHGILAEDTPDFALRLSGLLSTIFGKETAVQKRFSKLVSNCAELPPGDYFNALTLFMALGMLAENQQFSTLSADAHEALLLLMASDGYERDEGELEDLGVSGRSRMVEAFVRLLAHPQFVQDSESVEGDLGILNSSEQEQSSIFLRYLFRLINVQMSGSKPDSDLALSTLLALAKLIVCVRSRENRPDLRLSEPAISALYNWIRVIDSESEEIQKAIAAVIQTYPPRDEKDRTALLQCQRP